jgi:hypothetical protein
MVLSMVESRRWETWGLLGAGGTNNEWGQGSGIRDQDINNLLDRQDARMEGQDLFREKNKEEQMD